MHEFWIHIDRLINEQIDYLRSCLRADCEQVMVNLKEWHMSEGDARKRYTDQVEKRLELIKGMLWKIVHEGESFPDGGHE